MVHVYIRNDPLPTTDCVCMHAQVLRRSFTIRTCFFDLQLYSATGMWSKTFIIFSAAMTELLTHVTSCLIMRGTYLWIVITIVQMLLDTLWYNIIVAVTTHAASMLCNMKHIYIAVFKFSTLTINSHAEIEHSR